MLFSYFLLHHRHYNCSLNSVLGQINRWTSKQHIVDLHLLTSHVYPTLLSIVRRSPHRPPSRCQPHNWVISLIWSSLKWFLPFNTATQMCPATQFTRHLTEPDAIRQIPLPSQSKTLFLRIFVTWASTGWNRSNIYGSWSWWIPIPYLSPAFNIFFFSVGHDYYFTTRSVTLVITHQVWEWPFKVYPSWGRNRRKF